MDKKQNTEITELKAKVEIYEKWRSEESKVFFNSRLDSELHTSNEQADMRKLLKVIWIGKLKIIAITTVFAIASVFYALSLPNIFKSEALLLPTSQVQSGGGLNALAGQFGGLASLAGINIGGNTDKTIYVLEVLASRKFIYKFVEENDLKLAIMAADGWNREMNSLTYDKDVYNEETKTWVREVNAPYKPEPSLLETYEEFLKGNLSVTQDKDTGMVKIAINHYSPYLAKELVDKLIIAINLTIKQQDMAEATKSIKYLEQELENTKIAGAQTIFYQLIEQQQQKLMLTKVRDDYVLKVVDKAVVAERKVKPNRAVIVILGTMLGVALALFLVLVFTFRSEAE